jgi:hypothetical protein
VFSTGQGAEFGQRMGIVMFGGIMFSAILTFFVVPAAFFLFEAKRQVDFNAAKLEIEQACEEVEAGVLPPGCEEDEENPAIATSPVPILEAGATTPRRRAIRRVEEGEEYEL